MEAKEAIWKKCLEKIEESILHDNYTTWFSSTYPHNLEDGLMTVAVPNQIFRKCLIENYRELIENTLSLVANERLMVDFCIETEKRDCTPTYPEEKNNDAPNSSSAPGLKSLNAKHSFSSFVVGPSNQFAHAAAQAVSNNPSMAYNPLFIYGAVGLGKTHLLHSIGNEINKNNPKAQIRYISAESFTVDLIESIKRDKMPAFRERYRPLDVLLIDDIQFIAGKERTQEEFFYTFNALYESQKQVVISCDRYPKDLQNIEERIKSRFESGLVADINSPDLETKIAILYKKGEFHNKKIPQDVAIFIASNIKSNIRELEGFLLRVIAYSSFTRRSITLELAKEVLKDFTIDKTKNFTLQNILKATASYHNLKPSDIKSKRRTREISSARQIAMYLCREHTKLSLPDIGKQFGGKDHTTVIFSHKKISNNIKDNRELKVAINDILELVENS